MPEFLFRDCEFVTPTGELWHWRRAFLTAIESHAKQVLTDLASFLPLRHDLADSIKHFGEFSPEDQELIKAVEQNFAFFKLPAWLRKYGFNQGRLTVGKLAKRKGISDPQHLSEKTELSYSTCVQIWTGEPILPSRKDTERVCAALSEVLEVESYRLFKPGLVHFWGWIVALDTLQFWDEDDPPATGKRFIPIGRDVHKREILLAYPKLSESNLSGVTGDEQAEWQAEQAKYEQAAKKGDLILPPEGFDTWRPFEQTRQDYLSSQQENLTRLRQKGDRRLTGDYQTLLPKYCDRLETHYRKNGYKKLPANKRNIEKYILWTVQAHVLNKPYHQVTDPDGRAIGINTQGVKSRVDEVLERLDLAPRKDRKADRKAG